MTITPLAVLEAEIVAARDAYYNSSSPRMSDEQYDALVDELAARHPNHPLLQVVGTVPAGAAVQHSVPMLSLDKCLTLETLNAWFTSCKLPVRTPILIEPKIDGVSASIIYEGGKLVRAATRGDGLVGEDVTHVVRRIPDVPQTVGGLDPLEVRGEIYMRLSVFRTFGDRFKHPRNATVGALKGEGGSAAGPEHLSFYAYEMPQPGPRVVSATGVRSLLESEGFAVPPCAVRIQDQFPGYLESVLPADREVWDFEADGAVFKVQDLATRERLGVTAHHPRWAIAYKFAAESRIAVLSRVDWQVSRRQIITPVAVFSPPVRIAGADISNATLHNLSTFQALDPCFGDRVLVSRRGGVIPHIERISSRIANGLRLPVPTKCPACEGPVQEVSTGGALVLMCLAEECGGSQARVLMHWCKHIGADGFGPTVCAKLVAAELASDVPSLYTVDWQRAAGVVGAAVARNLQDSLLLASRAVATDKLLMALALPGVGETMARRIAGAFPFEDLFDLTPAQLAESCPNLGVATANGVIQVLGNRCAELAQLVLVDKHVTVIDCMRVRNSGVWENEVVCFTGELPVDRAMATGAAQRLGAEVSDNVTKKTTILVDAAGKPSTKRQKAEKLGTRIMSGDEFMALAFGEG